MAHAYIFPGQGAQFSGMGKELYDNSPGAKKLFDTANEILEFNIREIMFTGTDESLKQTRVTQPAIFIHSVAAFQNIDGAKPDMVAGHSLGEFSALVANKVLSFEDGLRLVSVRAKAMQAACETEASAMAAILGLADDIVEDICANIHPDTEEIVVAANYNCPGQLVISGSVLGVEIACERLKAAGAKRAIKLPVSGAFHSPFMIPARNELAAAIEQMHFNSPSCPVYQNVVAHAVSDAMEIKQNLISQLTGPVKWTQTIKAMIADGATHFTECGPGKVLQGLVQKIEKSVQVDGVS